MKSRYQPVAVIDIGSNSVRLVIYEGPWRHAAALHNEKAICAIGRKMVSTGHLDEDGTEYALETLRRFRSLCEGYGVKDFGAVATAAARDATNGKEFVRDAEKALGQPIQILSGEDEAKIAAEGTLAGIPGADGVVADLGGGSLDMVKVKDGKIGAAATLPFGPLRLMDLSDGNLNKARNAVEKGLDKLDFAERAEGQGALCGRGNLARARPCRHGAAILSVARAASLRDAGKARRAIVPRGRRARPQVAREDACGAEAPRRGAALWLAGHGRDDPCLRIEGGGHLRLWLARRRAPAQASRRGGGQGSASRIGARTECA